MQLNPPGLAARRDGHEAEASQFAPKFLQDATHLIARLHQHQDASDIELTTTYDQSSIGTAITSSARSRAFPLSRAFD